ncbi:MAG: ADP-glyceromanno-heptose 6-epimerase [Mariprofundales bacterium]
MKTYLVTGGAGFVGSNIAAALLQEPRSNVVIVDDFSSGDWRTVRDLPCEVRALNADDASLLAEIRAGVFTAVFHEAAITDTTVMDQRRMIEVNTNAFGKLLAACAVSSTRLIYASSAGVYGNSAAPNCVAKAETPANIYGFSKLAMDRLAAKWYGEISAPIIGLRYFNVYGPGESHKGKTASMAYQWYQQVKSGRQPRLFKNGEQRRDHVYIRDVVAANLAALHAEDSGVCNIGTGQARSYNDIIALLGTSLKQELKPEYIDNPYDFFQNHTEADLTETHHLLDWRSAWSLERGLADYYSLLEKNFSNPVALAAL